MTPTPALPPAPGASEAPRSAPPSDLAGLPVTVLMNAGSGSQDKNAAQAAIEAALAGRDMKVVVAPRPRELPALARRAAEHRPGILAAAGGDGTLNAVAAIALERDLPFAVIPLGTFNYFARDLGIPLDPAAAAGLIAAGAVRRVAVGRANGQIFLNNASIGLYRRLIEQREYYKRHYGRNRLVALFSAFATLFGRHPAYRLRLEIDGRPATLSTLTVFFGRNALQMEQVGLDEALCVARGELAVLALRQVDRWELLWLMLRGAFGRLETAPNLRQHCALRVDVDRLDGRSRTIRLAIDGEVVECSLPLVVESLPEALQVIVPAHPREER